MCLLLLLEEMNRIMVGTSEVVIAAIAMELMLMVLISEGETHRERNKSALGESNIFQW